MSQNKFLSNDGLIYLWGKIKTLVGTKADASSVPTKLTDLTNDAGFITSSDIPEGAAATTTVPKMDGTADVGKETSFARGDHVHPTDTSRLATNGDGSQVTATFNPAAERANIASGESISVIMGKLAKMQADLGTLAYKSGVVLDDMDSGIKASLAKADSALQSYTESDPTVPSWAKEATKPTYTASEVGAIPASDADTFAKKSDITNAYIYRGSVATYAALPTENVKAGDVYNVETDGMNYAYTADGEWDQLGATFEIQSITNAEIDALTA